jgi:hypothetical protein
MPEKRILIIAIPPQRSAEEQSLPELVSERGLARPAESKMPGKAETPAAERRTRIGCESMQNKPPNRRL